MTFSIELDCAPGLPRPDDLIPFVIMDTGVVLGDPISKFFGNWVWVIPADQEALYVAARPVVKERIEELYKDGQIRYGSW